MQRASVIVFMVGSNLPSVREQRERDAGTDYEGLMALPPQPLVLAERFSRHAVPRHVRCGSSRGPCRDCYLAPAWKRLVVVVKVDGHYTEIVGRLSSTEVIDPRVARPVGFIEDVYIIHVPQQVQHPLAACCLLPWCNGEQRLQIWMKRQYEFCAGLLLRHTNGVSRYVCPDHLSHVRAPLAGVKQQTEC
jgi:hypothetical protein